jgi:hypothetical protein
MSEKILIGNVLASVQGAFVSAAQEVLVVMAFLGVLPRCMQRNPASIIHLRAWGLMYETFILPYTEAP